MNFFKSIIAGRLLQMGVNAVAARLKADAAAMAALQAYNTGGSFLEMARAYTAATENTGDDQVTQGITEFEEDLERKPFRELLPQLLGGVKIPDFDGDPSDDRAAIDVLNEIVAEALR
jgi:hypothetical protein